MADRRITTEVVQMDQEYSEGTEDVEFQVPHIKRRLLGDFGRPSVLDPPVSEHMKVYLRVRPFSEDELERNESQGCLDIDSDYVITTVAPKDSHYYKKAARGQGKTITTNKYTFSRIFKEDATQKEFFNTTMLDLVKDFIDGQNCLVFSYGVTSSGKTYTIQGQPEDAGILPRALDVLFNSISGRQWSKTNLKPDLFMGVTRLTPEQELHEQKIKERVMKLSCEDDMDVKSLLGHDASDMSIATNTTMGSDCSMSSYKADSKDSMDSDLEALVDRVREETKVSVEDQGQIKFSIWVSFAEIYNEQIFDLLESIPKKKNVRRPCLKLSDDQNGSPYVKGLKYIHVTSADEAYKLLTIGQRNLKTACTRLNQHSSRSHCIFSIKVLRVIDKDSPHVARVSMLSLCDLAGSERYTKTKNSGERLKEAGNINTSLMTLGRCIETLKFNQLHKENPRIIPFRDSKLTRLFQNFFVGRGKAVMIVNVNQCASMFDETQHVFKFSAVASQVIVKQNPAFLKPKLPVIVPSPKLPPRSSIMWANTPAKEKVEALPKATNLPLPEESDDELDESQEVYTQENIDELLGVIQELQRDLDKEKKTRAKMETKIRKEVCDEMMKQFIEIEEQCSEQIRKREQLAEEMAEKRIQLVINAERAKRKKDQVMNDDDDEWVSSVLLHQEKVKVEEKAATIKKQKEEMKSQTDEIKSQADEIKSQAEEIAQLKAELKKVKSGEENWDVERKCLQNEINDLKNRMAQNEMKEQTEEDVGKDNLIENLTHQLQQSRERLQEQEREVSELNDMLTEAGETFVQKQTEIEQLKELNTDYEKKLEQLRDDIKQMERVAQDSKVAMETADQSLSKREECVATLQADIRDLEAEVTKYKNKARFFEEQIVQKEKEAEEWKIQCEHGQTEYAKSEEALIHGFNAEIASLKSQIFNFKSQLYGVRSPLKSPGGNLRSPDPARARLFSMSPRKTPGKEPKFTPVLPLEQEEESTQTHGEEFKAEMVDKEVETEIIESKNSMVDEQVQAEINSDDSNLENILNDKNKQLEDANQKIKELEPLMKDYFSKSKLLSDAEIRIEKLSEDAEYKNKAIEDCENRVKELETEVKELKAALDESKVVIIDLEEREKKLQGMVDKMEDNENKACDIQRKDVEIQAVVSTEETSPDHPDDEHEMHQLQSNINEKNKEIETLNKKLQTLKSGYKAKDMYFSEASEKCMELEFRINEKEIENEEFKSQVDEARKQMDMLQTVLYQKVEELARTGEELALTSLESEKSKRILTENKARWESLTTEIKTMKEKIQAEDKATDMTIVMDDDQEMCKMTSLEKSSQGIGSRLEELYEQINGLEKCNKTLEENLVIEKANLKTAHWDIENLKRTIKEKDSELLSVNEKLETKLSEENTVQSEIVRNNQAIEEIDTLKTKLQESEHTTDELEKQLSDLKSKESALLEEIKSLEGMKEEILKLESLIADKDKLCQELSEKVSHLSTSNSDLQDKLKAQKESSNDIAQLQNKIKNKDKEIVELQTMMKEKNEELELFKENLDATLLELEGKEKEKSEAESLKKLVESQKEILTEKEKEIKRISELYEEVDGKMKLMCNKQGKQSLEESMHDLESAVADKEMEIYDRETVIQEQKGVIENLKSDIEALEKDKVIFYEKLEKIEQNNQDLRETAEELQEKLKTVTEQFEDEKNLLAERLAFEDEQMTDSKDKFEEQLQELKIKVDESNSLLEEEIKEKELLMEKSEDLEKRISRLTEEKEEIDMKNKSYETDKGRLQGKLDEAWNKVYQLEDDLEEKIQQISDMKASQEELDQECESGNKDEHDLLAVQNSELKLELNKLKEKHELVESELSSAKEELRVLNGEVQKVKGELDEQVTISEQLSDKIKTLRKEISVKEEALSSAKESLDAQSSESNELSDVKDKLNNVMLEKNNCENEIENYKQKLEDIQKNCDKELESVKLKLEEVFTERNTLKEHANEAKLSKDSEKGLESEVALKNVEIKTLQMEVKMLNEELNRLKINDKVVKDTIVKQSEMSGEIVKSFDCDIDKVAIEELERLLESEKNKNEEYEKLLTETSEMHCLSPQTGVRKLRKAKIDAENALVEAKFKISSLESKVKDYEDKQKNFENSNNSTTSPVTSDSLLQRKLNYFTTKLQDTENKHTEKVADLEATIDQLEKDLREERSRNGSGFEREVHRRSSVAMIKNDPRQSVGSPSAHLEVIKIREREENMREQLKKANETLQEWMGNMVETENQLKQKKQELKHAQETIKNLETMKSEGERNIEKEVRQYMELTNELKLQIIKKEGDLEQKTNIVEDLRRQLENESKVIKERDSLIAMFKETMQEQELMLQQQDQLISEKEAKMEKSQTEHTDILEKYKELLASRDSTQKEHKTESSKLIHLEEKLENKAQRVQELENKLGQSEKRITDVEHERKDLEKKLKKSDDEKTRLKSALNENNNEVKELEKTLTAFSVTDVLNEEKKPRKSDDEKNRLKSALNENNHEVKELEKTLTEVRKECEELRSQGADKNAAMHLEEAKRDMEKNVHELNNKLRNLQCQNKELTFKLSSAEEKLKSMTEENKRHDKEDELQKFREERDKLVSALEACLHKKDVEIKQLKDVIKQLKDKEIQITKNWHEEREKIASGLIELQKSNIVIKQEKEDDEESFVSQVTNDTTVQDNTDTHPEDNFTKPSSPPNVMRSASKSRPPRPAPPKTSEGDASAMIEMLKSSPGSARRGSARRGKKRPSPSSAEDLPPLPKRSSREPPAETSVLSESSEDYSTHLQIDATPKAAAKSLRRTRKKTVPASKDNTEEPQTEEVTDSAKRGSKRNARNRLLQSFRESPIGKTSKKILDNIAERFSPTKSPSPPHEEEEPKKGRKRMKTSTKENTPVDELEVPEKKTSRGRGRHKLYKEDTYISEPIDNTGGFIQSPEDVHKTVTRSLRSRRH